MTLPDPVIVIPGITANYLRDNYPLPPEYVWTVLNLDYERVALHPDDLRYEAAQPSLVRPDQLYELVYKELVEELRHNLTAQPDEPVPVFPFSYDWRQPLELIEIQLKNFVEEVGARTSLLPHYLRDGYPQRRTVNLVGHSMGGLVLAGYIERYGRQSGVRKVVTLATPFRGSFEAVIKITTGTADLGTPAPKSREREAARMTPALYYLLPRVPGITFPPGLSTSLFDAGCWQPSVLQTIAQYIKKYGTNPVNPAAQADATFRKLLASAEGYRNRLDAFTLAQSGLATSDWMCIVGVDSTTRVKLQIIRRPDGTPDFQFHTSDRENEWSSTNPAQRTNTGDGTVPFLGAVPSFLSLENLICVTPDDYGYWEVQDRMTTQVAGFHGILPNMDMLHRLITRYFTGAPDTHGNTWGRRAPGAASWQPPLPLQEK